MTKQTIFFIILLFITHLSNAQLGKKYSGYEQKKYKALRYGLFKPANYDSKKAYPLILYLHGASDTLSRDLGWYQESIQREYPSFILTPKCTETNLGWGSTWSSSHTEDMTKTLLVVDSIVQKYNIDRNRLYLYGISMGGFGTFSVLEKNPGKFAAAYAVCGGSDVKAASKLLSTPLWIFHGELDDVVDVKYSRDVYKEMIRLGGTKVKYTEYPGVKHNSWENVSREKDLVRWLFAQSNGRSLR